MDIGHGLDCHVLSEGPPVFFGFLILSVPRCSPERVELNDLLFDPDENMITEMGGFFKSGNIIHIISPTGVASGYQNSGK